MGVSKNRGTPWKTLLKWTIWVYHHFRKSIYLTNWFISYLLQLGSSHIRETESALGLLGSFGTSSEGGLSFVWKENGFPGSSRRDLFGCVKWPFQGLSDLHLGDQKVTGKKLVPKKSWSGNILKENTWFSSKNMWATKKNTHTFHEILVV